MLKRQTYLFFLPALRRIGFIYLFLICTTNCISGQITPNFKIAKSNDGSLPSIIRAIVQDSFGRIWAATEEGVLRYNGSNSRLYTNNNGLPANLKSRIYAIFSDKKGGIWAGSENALLQFLPGQNTFRQVNKDLKILPIQVKAIAEDEKGRIWFGATNGLWIYDPDQSKVTQLLQGENIEAILIRDLTVFVATAQGLFKGGTGQGQLEKVQVLGLPIGHMSLLSLPDQSLLLGTRKDGLWHLDQSLGQAAKIDLPGLPPGEISIRRICSGTSNDIYVATDGSGIFKLKQLKPVAHFLNNSNQPHSLSSNGVYDVLLGKEEILWVATYGGSLNKASLEVPFYTNVQHLPNVANSLNHNFVRAICEDKQGNIWYGTKEGISIWQSNQQSWRHIRNFESAASAPMIVMALAEQGDYIWVGTYGQGAYRLAKSDLSVTRYHPMSQNKIALQKVYAICIDQAGAVWLGGIESDLIKIRPDGSMITFPISQVKGFALSQSGGIYSVGRMGLHFVKDEQVKSFDKLSPDLSQLSYSTFNCVAEAPDGRIYIGTANGGLVIYQPDTDQIESLGKEAGLPSNNVQGLVLMSSQKLWLSTTNGLAMLTLPDKTMSVYQSADGLANQEYNYGSYAALSGGRLAFGGIDGATVLDPSQIKPQTFIPTVVFEEMSLLGVEKPSETKEFDLTQAIKVPYHQNALNIKFASGQHSAPLKTLYQWKIEKDGKWSKPSSETQLQLVNLASGKYTLFVRASNRDGVFGPESSLSFRILPPWWRSIWAYLFYIAMVAGAIQSLLHFNKLKVKEKHAADQIAFFRTIIHEIKTPLAILLASIDDPSIQEIEAVKGFRSKIKQTSARLNALFVQLLNFNKVTGNNDAAPDITKIQLEKQFSLLLDTYQPLLQEKQLKLTLSNESGLDYFHYDFDTLEKILNNLVTNAAKYSRSEGEIKITLTQEGKDGLKIEVRDNGIGIPADQQKYILKRYYRGRNAINSNIPGTGLGLMIVKSLIERDKGGSISFTSQEGVGTAFTAIIKDQKANYITKVIKPFSDLRTRNEDHTVQLERSRARILVVEDNDILRDIICEKLREWFEIVEAPNGAVALQMVHEVFPDLILTDNFMPDMSGMDLANHLINDINTCHIPIFMMTGLSSNTSKLESAETGIDAHFEKPIDFDYLLTKIQAAIKKRQKLSEHYAQDQEVNSAVKFRSERDAAFIQELEAYVLEHIKDEELSVYDLCRMVNMSRTALYMKLKAIINISPQDLIILTRMRHARKLLVESGGNIKEVAYMTGFSNPKYFSTSFKKVFGESPSDYLKALEKREL
jgi:signal transduction histidine kinase/ligand-binding sensor domain-containing protein/CheY-like chemotaxis protein/AraC-like DNA-binding protein